MKEQKTGLTTTNWILSILGIILLTCVIILPPVFRTFLKEEVVEETPNLDLPIISTICYKEKISGTNYEDNITFVFSHQDKKLKEFSKKTDRTYLDPLVYQDEKQNYGKLVTAFSIIEGFDYTATPDDNNSQVIIRENYDLKNFKATVIVVPGDTDTTEISSTYLYDDSINTVLSSLKSDGYVCE